MTSQISHSDTSPVDPILELYAQRSDGFQQQVRTSESILSKFGLARGLSFLAAIVFLILALTTTITPWIGFTVSGCSFLAFLVIAFVHENADRRLSKLKWRMRINDQAGFRIRRDWQQADVPKVDVDEKHQALSKDLDLFGKASLYQLVCTAKTPIGRARLADWFVNPANADEVQLRQLAVKQLAPQIEAREDLQLHGNMLRSSKAGPENLIKWTEGGTWLESRKWLHLLAVVLATAMVVAVFVTMFGLVTGTVGGSAILILLMINTVITLFTSGTIHWIFRQVSQRAGEVQHYVSMFALAEEIEGDAQLLKEIRETLIGQHHSANTEMGKLSRIMSYANMRSSGLLFLVYLVTQFMFLWDIHILRWLENWQQKSRDDVGKWFEAIGEWEALSALSQVAHDHPHWVWPEFIPSGSPKKVTATQIGHPLLDEETRVLNDASLGPVGSVLLVTGSNMSGKSTLLRSIGSNITLAQAGTVVCASEMSLSPVLIETSMRISDSLASGVSFMAELQRLKEIVDIAKDLQQDSQRTLLYLLDEILQGTNSTERHIAVQRVLEHLINSEAIGAISTHDLDLADAAGIADCVQPVHFREHFSEDDQGVKKMTFDYCLREGVATTTNALKLLELVGLRDVDHPSS